MWDENCVCHLCLYVAAALLYSVFDLRYHWHLVHFAEWLCPSWFSLASCCYHAHHRDNLTSCLPAVILYLVWFYQHDLNQMLVFSFVIDISDVDASLDDHQTALCLWTVSTNPSVCLTLYPCLSYCLPCVYMCAFYLIDFDELDVFTLCFVVWTTVKIICWHFYIKNITSTSEVLLLKRRNFQPELKNKNSLLPRGAFFSPLESNNEVTSGWNFPKCISEVKVKQLKVKNIPVKMGISTFK